MNPVDYSQLPLRDIHLPLPVGWWPPAPGWWLLFTLAVSACALLAWRYRSQFRERAALRALRRVQLELEAGRTPVACMQRISSVLRRFAMSVAGGLPVAGLTGERWLKFLDSRWEQAAFSEGPGRVLIFGPYAPDGRVTLEDVQTLNLLCMDWIRTQRPES
jgi:hypothetical protein